MLDSVKSRSVSALSQYMDETFDNLKYSDPEFAQVLHKWKNLFFSTVQKVAAVKGSNPFDVFQELMVPLVKINEVHKLKLYRYKKKVYELDKVDGFNVRLVPLRYNIRKSPIIWTRREWIEPIKQASISALVYRKIQQQSSVMVRSVFTRKNGYSVVSEDEGYVKMRNGEYGEKYKSIKKNTVVKVCSEVSLDSKLGGVDNLTVQDILADSEGTTAEGECEINELSWKLLERLSAPAQLLFKFNLANPGMKDRQAAKLLKFSWNKFNYAKREIIQNYLLLTKQNHKSSCNPYVIFNGNYFYLIDEDGDYLIIDSGNQPRYVHKSRVKVEHELAYRTPVHLPASMVA